MPDKEKEYIRVQTKVRYSAAYTNKGVRAAISADGWNPENEETLRKQITRVRQPLEREWLNELLDFQLSARNLNYCVQP